MGAGLVRVRRWAAGRAGSGEDRQRGDVPGWVLVTVMTAGLVIGLWAVAAPALQDVFTQALGSVQGP